MKYERLPSFMTIWNICNSPCKTINKKAKSQQNVFHKELNVETLRVTNKKIMWKKWLSNADHRNDSQSIVMRIVGWFNSI